MKKTKFSEIVSFALAAVILLCCAFSFNVSAVSVDEITETAVVASVNVEHRDFMHLAFMVEETAEHTGTIGIMIWEADETNFTAETAIYSNYQTSKDSADNVYYAGHAIAAKNIGTDYLVAVVEKDAEGGVTVISVPEAHSIKAWAQTKLTQSPDAVHENLYKKVIAYGEAASAVIK